MNIAKGLSRSLYCNSCIYDVVKCTLKDQGFAVESDGNHRTFLVKRDGGKTTFILPYGNISNDQCGNDEYVKEAVLPNALESSEIKILTPYLYVNRWKSLLEYLCNLVGIPYHPLGHWCTLEADISISDDQSSSGVIKLHNPRGGGNAASLIPNLKGFKGCNTKFKCDVSSYKHKRQRTLDFTSCGPIVAEEIIQLATTGKIKEETYSHGVLEIRMPQLKALIEEDSQGFTHVMDHVIKNQREFFSEEEIKAIDPDAKSKLEVVGGSNLAIYDPEYKRANDIKNKIIEKFTEVFKQKVKDCVERDNAAQSSTPPQCDSSVNNTNLSVALNVQNEKEVKEFAVSDVSLTERAINNDAFTHNDNRSSGLRMR